MPPKRRASEVWAEYLAKGLCAYRQWWASGGIGTDYEAILRPIWKEGAHEILKLFSLCSSDVRCPFCLIKLHEWQDNWLAVNGYHFLLFRIFRDEVLAVVSAGGKQKEIANPLPN